MDTNRSAEALFRRLDREVWAVTSASTDQRGALLATWVMQASLSTEPPLLLAGIAPNHHTASVIDRSGVLAGHLLAEDQAQMGLHLAASSGHVNDKLASFATEPASTTVAAPVLSDCLGWVAGPVVARLDAGDRIFYWIQVTASKCVREGPPLRQSALLAAASDDVKQTLKLDRESDIRMHEPLRQQWLQLVAAGRSTLTSS